MNRGRPGLIEPDDRIVMAPFNPRGIATFHDAGYIDYPALDEQPALVRG